MKVNELRVELFRKAIHMLVAIVPFLAAMNVTATMALLSLGAVLYTTSEYLRSTGHDVFLISRVTVLASRTRDRGRFVLGPVTLGIGAMLALMLYPEPAATIAIFALAFGDSISSLVGKLYGRVRIPLTGGKTYAGSLACFVVVLFIAYRVTDNILLAIPIAFVATALEAFPTKDLDNILMPVGTGFIASELLSLTG
ncbi:MAG: phosphatidate cytidylyltransferase [Spirochaetales bacterium]|nr:phosphatidate cytidylyltransferase [Spirochaetales bacterium]